MRALAIGNSHMISLQDFWRVARDDPHWSGLELDIIPLNFCMPYHHLFAEGKGTIQFPRVPAMPAFEYDASNYDALAIVGAFVGGDGIFRSLVARTCFTPLTAEQVAMLAPNQVTMGRKGKPYNKPPVVLGPYGVEDDLQSHQLISAACLDALLDWQLSFRADLFKLERLCAIFPRVLWFESPFPKRSVLSTQWGLPYAASRQSQTLKEGNDRAVARSPIAKLTDFRTFPDAFRDQGIWLRPEFGKTSTSTDIHAGDAFGRYIAQSLREAA